MQSVYLSQTYEVNIKLMSDSSSAIAITRRQGPGKKSKHIEIKYLFVQDLYKLGTVTIAKVHTDDNMSDLQTKYLSSDKLSKFIAMQMLRDGTESVGH